MLKVLKKVILSSLSILGISLICWCVLFFNPNISYAHETQFENVTVFHNDDLAESTSQIIQDAITILKNSDLFSPELSIQLCLNDDGLYPHMHPMLGGPSTEGPLAYALFDKAIIRSCDLDFDSNLAVSQWEMNDNEIRKWNLTQLIAHEFVHNMQWKRNMSYSIRTTLGKLNWKLEGHAEYISHQYKGDGRLLEKIEHYIRLKDDQYVGIPVFENQEGRMQNLWYYKNALMVQYLMEVKRLNYDQVCEYQSSHDEVYSEMIKWSLES